MLVIQLRSESAIVTGRYTKMESRQYDRELKHINVRLYHDNTFVNLSKTCDITVGGMFINTDPLLFPKNSSLNIVFDSPLGNSGRQHRYSATVVHRCLKGIGIRLNDNNALNEYLSNEKSSIFG